MKTKERKNSRFAFWVFIGLVVFCAAQLTWWIIFQIETGQELYRLKVDNLFSEADRAVMIVNDRFDSIERRVLSAIGSPSEENWQRSLNALIENSALSGYTLGSYGRGRISVGDTESRLRRQIDDSVTIFYDSMYVDSVVKALNPNLMFSYPVESESRTWDYVNQNMLKVRKTALNRLKSESNRRIIMFVSEGSFFLVIMIIGAFLIYRALQKTEELNRRQIGFMQAVTHEFRTPLTSLRLYLETLKGGKLDKPKSNEIYDKMLADCDRLNNLVDNALDAGRLGGERVVINLKDTNLSNDIEEYINSQKPYIERKRGTFTEDIEPDISAKTDYQAMRRVFQILIDNALNYSPEDRKQIRISLKKKDEKIVLKISDEGIGIEEKEKEKIFRRFYRINNESTKKSHGAGLGLYLARQIIEGHKGSIRVEPNSEGDGSTFIIELPAT